jgi:hypothetical protein
MYPQGQGIAVEEAACRGHPTPLAVQRCTSPACPAVLWRLEGAWSACSAPCAGVGDAALGVSTTTPPVCYTGRVDGSLQVMPSSFCESIGLVSGESGCVSVCSDRHRASVGVSSWLLPA